MTAIIKYLKAHYALRHTAYHIISLAFMLLTVGVPDHNGGPCNAGLESLMYLPVFLIDVILVLISLAMLGGKGRPYLLLFIINLSALVFVLALNFISF